MLDTVNYHQERCRVRELCNVVGGRLLFRQGRLGLIEHSVSFELILILDVSSEQRRGAGETERECARGQKDHSGGAGRTKLLGILQSSFHCTGTDKSFSRQLEYTHTIKRHSHERRRI